MIRKTPQITHYLRITSKMLPQRDYYAIVERVLDGSLVPVIHQLWTTQSNLLFSCKMGIIMLILSMGQNNE